MPVWPILNMLRCLETVNLNQDQQQQKAGICFSLERMSQEKFLS